MSEDVVKWGASIVAPGVGGQAVAMVEGTKATVNALVPKMPELPAVPPPPSTDDPNAQKNLEAARAAERGQRGRASTILTGRSLASDPTVFRRSLLGN